MINSKLLIGVGIAVFFYLLYRMLTAPVRVFKREFEKEMKEILTKKEYQVKGRHE